MTTKAIEIKRRLTERFSQYAAQCAVFFRGFVEYPQMVGSIIPSSRFTVRKMLASVDWAIAICLSNMVPGSARFAVLCWSGCAAMRH